MDYFNEHERIYQQRFAASRDRFFHPVILLLKRLGARPNHISFLGVFFLIIACLMPKNYPWAVMFLFLVHLLCDAVDGPLARVRSEAHPGGALVDILVDQSSVVFIPAAAVFQIGLRGELAVVFSSSYLVFIALVLYANEHDIKLKTFVRLKLFLYALYCISLFLKKDIMTIFLIPFTIYYLSLIFYALRGIYRHYDHL